MKTLTLESVSTEQTERIGAQVGAALPSGMAVELRGELGAGKTVFVRGVARGFLGLPNLRITSPTYVLQCLYRHGARAVYHVDAYRIGGGWREFEDSGLGDCLQPVDGIACLEWPERIEDANMLFDLTITLDYKGEGSRIIRISGNEPLFRLIEISLSKLDT